MKKSKVIFAVLPLSLIAILIYVSSIAYSPLPDIKTGTPGDVVQYAIVDGKLMEVKEKPSVTCGFKVHPSSDCSCTSITFCINGGTATTVPYGAFLVWLEEGHTYNICAQCGTCHGSITVTSGPSPCGITDVDLTLKQDGQACNCVND